MYTYPVHCRDAHTASKARPSRPSMPDSRHSVVQDLVVAQVLARAMNDNPLQRYRGV
ncbi:hypothetical protein [uncultured Thiodictyon sp.]|uniref:hypothetical protein n=1 Tax=uncultured Thiodictyon sp. TaxID=1846217 RepID=UPI0025F57CAB|nr:hypothetical protein [uncultured Thiodictyon sp.]